MIFDFDKVIPVSNQFEVNIKKSKVEFPEIPYVVIIELYMSLLLGVHMFGMQE